MKTWTKQQWIGSICLSLAAAIWGGLYVVSEVVLDVVPPFTLLGIRFLIAFFILYAMVLYRREKVKKQDIPNLILISLVGIPISIGAQFLGTKWSTAHMGAIITSASPAFIALFAVWLLKEKMKWQHVLGLSLATAGVLVVVGLPTETSASSTVLLGNLTLLVAAVSWGLYTVLSKRATAVYSSLAVTAYVAGFGFLLNLPIVAWEWSVTPVNWDWSGEIWLGILYISIVSTAGAFYLWNKGFELLNAGSAAGFFFFQPIVGVLLGWLLLGEHLSLGFFAGAVLILVGVAVSSRQQSSETTENI
jgi:drug/metabolite transporter (DMT)-like permease